MRMTLKSERILFIVLCGSPPGRAGATMVLRGQQGLNRIERQEQGLAYESELRR